MKQGEITIAFDKGEAVLRPTPHALRTVLTKFGGGRAVQMNLLNMNYEAVFELIKVGTMEEGDKWTNENTKILEASIYNYGFSDLIEPCVRYLNLLMNAGREPEAETEGEE